MPDVMSLGFDFFLGKALAELAEAGVMLLVALVGVVLLALFFIIWDVWRG